MTEVFADVDLVRAPVPRKHGFPEGIPGLYALSKSEVNDDLDVVYSQLADAPAGDRSQRLQNLKRRKRPANDAEVPDRPEPAVDDERVSKRSRIWEKIGRDRKTLAAARTMHTNLRDQLDQVRAEVTQYRDAINQTKRELEHANNERKAIDEKFKAVQNDFTKTIEQNKQRLEESDKAILELQRQLYVVQHQAGESRQQAEQLQLRRREQEEQDNRILYILKQLRAMDEYMSQNGINPPKGLFDRKVLLEAPPISSNMAKIMANPTSVAPAPQPDSPKGGVQAMAASTAGPTVKAERALAASPTMATRMDIDTDGIPGTSGIEHVGSVPPTPTGKPGSAVKTKVDNQARLEAKTREIEQLNKQLMEQTEMVVELKKALTEHESQREQAAKQLTQLEERIVSLSKHIEEKDVELQGFRDDASVQRELIDIADRRAAEAENSLHEVVSQVGVLEGGNRTLQVQYDAVREQLEKLSEERTRLQSEADDSGKTANKHDRVLQKQSRDIVQYRARLAELISSSKTMQAQLQSAVATKKQLEKRVEVLQKKVTDLSSAFHDKQLSTVATLLARVDDDS